MKDLGAIPKGETPNKGKRYVGPKIARANDDARSSDPERGSVVGKRHQINKS